MNLHWMLLRVGQILAGAERRLGPRQTRSRTGRSTRHFTVVGCGVNSPV